MLVLFWCLVCGFRGLSLICLFVCCFISIVDFFKELPQFVVRAGSVLSSLYGPDWENRLEVLS